MPVDMEVVLEKGWKESENNRFGYVVVIRFINSSDGRVLFKFAPLLKDKAFFAEAFNSVYYIDDLHKEYIKKLKDMGIRFSSEIKEQCTKSFDYGDHNSFPSNKLEVKNCEQKQ